MSCVVSFPDSQAAEVLRCFGDPPVDREPPILPYLAFRGVVFALIMEFAAGAALGVGIKLGVELLHHL
jgi:hypothetical protein